MDGTKKASLMPGYRAFIALGAFSGLLLFVSNGGLPISAIIDGSSLWLLLLTALSASTCCGLFFALRGLKRIGNHPPGMYTAIVLNLGGLLFIIAAQVITLPKAFGVIGSVGLGVGLVITGIRWGMYLSCLQEADMIRTTVIAGFIGSIARVLLLFLPASLLMPGIMVLLLTASLPPMRDSFPALKMTLAEKTNHLVRGLIERNWVLFFGLILCLSIKALTWKAVLFNSPPMPPSSGIFIVWGNAVGAILGSTLLLLLGRKGSPSHLSRLAPYAPFFCVFFVILVWILGVWEQGFYLFGPVNSGKSLFICNLPTGLASTLLTTLLVIRLCAETNSGRSSRFVFGLLAAAVSGFFLLLVVIQAILPLEAITVYEVSSRFLYFLIAVFHMIVLTQNTTRKEPVQDEQIQSFCDIYKLSKREKDILIYLLQGRSAPYIAETEYISLNTVRTHMKRIYTKVGVHKREELLGLFYMQPESSD